MKLKNFIAGHLLLLVLVFSQTVSAEEPKDFTFHVHVNYSNLHPDVDRVKVLCEVDRIGEGSSIFDIPSGGGSHGAIVQVDFDAEDELTPQANPETRDYKCNIKVSKSGSDNFKSFYPSDSGKCNKESKVWRCPKPGAPFSDEISGTVDLFKKPTQ